MITHIFFDLHNTLVDGQRLHHCYSAALGTFMAARYGGDPAAWAEANRRVVADWDAYYADLDLTGPDGLAHQWEGQTRTLRALFRLMQLPYPNAGSMRALVRDHHFAVTSQCDGFYPDAHSILPALRQEPDPPLVLGVTSHGVHEHIRGCLTGAGVRDYFCGPLVGPDDVGHFSKDAVFYRFAFMRAKAVPAACAVIDDSLNALYHAQQLGAMTILIDRTGRYEKSKIADHCDAYIPDLAGLPELLWQWATA